MYQKLCCIVFAVLVASVGLASADIITYSDSFANITTELVNRPLRVNLFDTALGTLNKVTVTLSGSLTSSGTVKNNAAQAQDFSVFVSADPGFPIFGKYRGTLAGGSPAALPNPFNFGLGLIGSQAYTQLASGASAPFGSFTINSGSLTALSSTAPGILTQFDDGPGLFGYDFNTTIGIVISGGGGNITSAIATVASGTLDVAYEFTPNSNPVPEPSTLSLLAMGSGLFVLGLKRYKSRQNS